MCWRSRRVLGNYHYLRNFKKMPVALSWLRVLDILSDQNQFVEGFKIHATFGIKQDPM